MGNYPALNARILRGEGGVIHPMGAGAIHPELLCLCAQCKISLPELPQGLYSV